MGRHPGALDAGHRLGTRAARYHWDDGVHDVAALAAGNSASA